MTWVLIVLLLAAPLVFMALLVRSARCRLCKTAAAARLVGMLLLWAAQSLVGEAGVPWPVLLVAGVPVAVVVLEPLPRWLSRWLHTGPPCAISDPHSRTHGGGRPHGNEGL